MNKLIVEVFIGGGYSFKKEETIAAACLSNSSVKMPGHKGTIEFEKIHSCTNYVYDLFDFYNEYLDKEVIKDFVVNIHLNTYSNQKRFHGEDSLKAMEYLENNYTKDLRIFN